jgi:hypothetical protein
VDELWLHEIESLEALSSDDATRRVFLRMAELQQHGSTMSFVLELERDDELDEETKLELAQLATDRGFLHAFEDYVVRTRALH